MPRQVLEWWADPVSPYFRPGGIFGDFDRRVVTFCDGGGNDAFSAVVLQELGYRNVATLEGGFFARVGSGLPIVGQGAQGSPEHGKRAIACCGAHLDQKWFWHLSVSGGKGCGRRNRHNGGCWGLAHRRRPEIWAFPDPHGGGSGVPDALYLRCSRSPSARSSALDGCWRPLGGSLLCSGFGRIRSDRRG